MIVVVAQLAFVAAGACALGRLLVGPTLADRVVALDVALISLMSGIAIDAAATGDSSALVLPAVIAIIGFTIHAGMLPPMSV